MSWNGNLTASINNVDLFEGEDGALEAIYTAGAVLSISTGRPIDKNGMMSWLFMVIPDGKATKGISGRQHHQFFWGVGGMKHSVINGTISRVAEGGAAVACFQHAHTYTFGHINGHRQPNQHTHTTFYMHTGTHTMLR